jgi:type I restriction enzyme S subunit
VTDAPWQERTIASLCEKVTSGGTPSRGVSSYFVSKSEQSIPWLKTKELNDGFIYETEEHITKEALENSSAKIFPKNTVVMAMYGATVGKLGVLGEPMSSNQAVCAMLVDPAKCDARFLFYSLLYSRASIISLATGSAQQNLSGEVIKGVRILIPSLSEQKRISGVLGSLDDLIEVCQALAATCENLAIASVEAIGSSVPLSDFAQNAPTDTRLPITTTDHYSLPAFDVDRMPHRVDGREIKSNKIILLESVVLVSRLNPRTARIWMVYPDLSVTSAASTEFVPLLGKRAATEEVWALCSTEQFLSQMKRLVTGTTGSHQRVDKKSILSLNIPNISKLDSLKRAAIRSLVAQAHAARVEVQQLVQTRNELLPLLMSGRVFVKENVA